MTICKNLYTFFVYINELHYIAFKICTHPKSSSLNFLEPHNGLFLVSFTSFSLPLSIISSNI